MKTKPNVALLSRNEERLVRMGLWELLGTSRLTNANEIETAVALWKHFGGNADAFKVGTRDK